MAHQADSPPSQPGATVSTIKNWAYPFPARDSRLPMTALSFLAALASAEDGFYPLGVNGVWHGGIHFGDGTGGTLAQEGGVRCIADGEVVAYRIDSKYPQLTYPDGRKALYSSGFTLVRHHLVLPPAPTASATASGQTASPSSAPNPADTLTFFTLYMHVLDWAGYQADTASNAAVKKSLPAYYKGKTIYQVGSRAKDAQKPATDSANTPTGDTPPIIGIHIRDAASGHTKLGILPQGSRMTIGETHGKWGKIASIESGAPVALQAGGTVSPQAARGWVYLKELDRTGEPDPLDAIVVLDPPHAVQAGDVISYLGEYQRAGDTTSLPPQPMRPLLHLETFSGDDLPSFLARSRARAEQLPADQRTLLVISEGALLVQPSAADQTLAYGTPVQLTSDSPSGGLWVKVQAMQTGSGNSPASQPVGQPVWISNADFVTANRGAAWSSFPLKLQSAASPKAAYLRVAPIADQRSLAKDDAGNTWYQVSVGIDGAGSALGWVCDKSHPLVKLDSPWAWPGFEPVELDASLTDLFKRTVHLSDGSWGDEIASFKQTFELLRNAPLLKKLQDAIDRQGLKDGKITSTELKSALHLPWLADLIQRLVVRYESEWGGEMSKWDALTPLMHDGAPFWKTEMERIEKLRFWEQVAAIKEFPASPTVYHFHPIGLIGNFIDDGCDCATRFKKISRIILNHEGGFSDRKADKGGATNHGIAWAQWQAYAKEDLGVEPTLENLKALTEAQAEVIYLKRYWEPKGFCKFKDERVALMVYDWTITSGGAAKQIQKMLNQKYDAGVSEDGGMGAQTVDALVAVPNQDKLLSDITALRKEYYNQLVANDPSQTVNLKGWINRVDDCLRVGI